MEQLIGMSDAAFLGRVGEVELGASALAGIYYMVLFMLGFGFSLGTQIIIARRDGEGNYRRIGQIFYQGAFFLLIIAFVLFFVSLYYSNSVLNLLIESQDVRYATERYIHWRVFGLFFSFLSVLFRAFYIGTAQTKTLTVNSIVMVLSNVLFNYILIFGKLGFPALGIEGAAIASSLAELVSLLFFIIYTSIWIDWRKYGFNRFSGFDIVVLKNTLKTSVWTMIQNFVSCSTWFIFFIAIEHLGERPLAISNIVRNVSAIPFLIVASFASTASSLVSNLIGSNETHYFKGTCFQFLQMANSAVLLILVLIFLFPSLVLQIYTDNVELIQQSVLSIRVMASSYIFSTSGIVMFQIVSSTGNTRSALLLEISVLVIYLLYVFAIVICLRMDVAFCWTAEHIYAGFILLFSVLYLKKSNWRNKKI